MGSHAGSNAKHHITPRAAIHPTFFVDDRPCLTGASKFGVLFETMMITISPNLSTHADYSLLDRCGSCLTPFRISMFDTGTLS